MEYGDYMTLAEKRRKEIYQMHLDNPKMTLKEIGTKFGNIKKQRVRQIIEVEKLAIRATVKARQL